MAMLDSGRNRPASVLDRTVLEMAENVKFAAAASDYAALSMPRSLSLRYSVERPIPRRRATSVIRPR